MRRQLIRATLCAALAAAWAAGAAAAELRREFRQTLGAPRGTVLRLRHGDGDVVISPWEKDSIEVSVRYRAEHKGFGDAEAEFDVEVRERNGVIEVTGRERREGFQPFLIYILKVYEYEISAPPWVDLELYGDDGDVDIERFTGALEIRSDDGALALFDCSSPRAAIRCEDGSITIRGHSGMIDIRADDADMDFERCAFGTCRIEAEDGRIRARDCTGNFEIERDDGDTELRRISTRVMNLRSADGRFDVELLGSGAVDIDIGTDGGTVMLALNRGISAAFAIDVDDARIRADLPEATDVQKGRRWMSGTLGSGEGKIRIRTSDGPVTVRELH